MRLTRRAFIAAPALATAARDDWPADWDRAVIDAALARMDKSFDARESMLRVRIGTEYRYHTTLRDRDVHPTRDSLEYAQLLLEAGRDEDRAAAILDRVVALQDTGSNSPWLGIWGYYLEEPPSKMAPADWNWADFNGALLLLIERRRGGRLPPALRARVRDAIREAAYSIRRRNVSMLYTNIAVLGTFVTLAAAELLADHDLLLYGLERLHRFARAVDDTGSFAEYNSPTYTQVTIANLTRIRMLVGNKGAVILNHRIHYRAWLHLARHWHAPTRQLAGPMSRCYSTEIGAPLWLQKALGNRLVFAGIEDLRSGRATSPGEVGVLDYRCPADLVPAFLELTEPRQHRELFLPSVQGTTFLDRGFSVGSANRSDFWVQRRPLLAYWGGPPRPTRHLRARFLKDDYDFASALFFSVQERNYVLALVNFQSPGGDRHPSLDPVRDGEFTARRLRLRLETSGDDRGPFRFQVSAAAFGRYRPSIHSDGVDLLRSEQPVTIRWREIESAYVVFTLAFGGEGGGACEVSAGGGTVTAKWRTPSGVLELTGSTRIAPAAEQNAAFRERIDGKPVPLVRLSDETLDPGI